MTLNFLPTTDTMIIRVVEAIFNQAPGYIFLNSFRTYVAENNIDSLANVLGNLFSGETGAQFAARITANLGLTGAVLTAGNAYLEAQFLAYPAARGKVVLDAMNLLATLESDATFGSVAAAYNATVDVSLSYSTVSTNTSALTAGIGKTFTLSTGTDNSGLFGTSKNDIYNAVVDLGTASGDTLTSGDNITANGGTDRLNIQGIGTGSPTVSGVSATGLEEIVISNLDTGVSDTLTLDAGAISGLTHLYAENSTATGEVSVTKLKSLVDGVMTDNLGDLTLGYSSIVTFGSNNIQKLLASGTNGRFIANGFETIAITTTGSPVTLSAVTSTELNKITVSGDHDLTLTDAVAAATVDAVAFKGDLTISTTSTSGHTVTGGSGADTLTGGSSTDNISGGGGADTITGGTGADTLLGGADNDNFIYLLTADLMTGKAKTDTAVIGGDGAEDKLTIGTNGTVFAIANGDVWTGITTIEKIVAVANTAAVTIALDITAQTVTDITTVDISAVTKSTGNVVDASEFTSTSTSLMLKGSATGATTLKGGAGSDTLIGGAGADVFSGGAGADVISGEAGADTISGDSGADTIAGDAGADMITGGDGADVIDGGDDNDTFIYVATADLVAANALVDRLTGGGGTADAIAINNNGGATFTLASTDLIEARMSGVEKIVAAGASNKIISITASDGLFEDGVTTIDLSADTNATGSNVIDVSNDDTGDNAWTLTGSAGIDTITGDSGVDTITGGSGADVIAGGDGDDSLIYLLTADLFTSQAKVDGSVAGNEGSGDKLTVGTTGTAFAIAANDVWTGITTVEKIVAVANSVAVTIDLDVTAYAAGIRTVDISLVDSGNNGSNVIDISEFVGTDATTLTGADGTGSQAITGGAGADTITGGAGADVITGGAGADVIDGGADNDVIHIADSTDIDLAETITGGADTNTMIMDAASTSINDADFANTLLIQAFTLANGTNTAVFGSNANAAGIVTITGGTGADTITTGSGVQTINAGAGADVITGGAGADVIDGGADNDVIHIADSTDIDLAETITGGAGTNTMIMDAASTSINDADFANTLLIQAFTLANGTNTAVFGSNANAAGIVTITGGTGADTVTTGSGVQTINAGAGADVITGGAGADVIDGGADNDVIHIADSTDIDLAETITGGAGTNTMIMDAASTSINDADFANTLLIQAFTLANGTNTAVFGSNANAAGIVTITGGTGADTITTGSGVQTINAGAGADVITGGAGADVIDGGADNDVIHIADSTDIDLAETITGGAGTNTMIMDAASTSINDADFANTLLIQAFTLANGTNTAVFGSNANAAGIVTITGGTGADTITTGSGVQTITAGTGPDQITAGASIDIINITDSGSSAHKIFTGALAADADLITGFTKGEDIIDISAADASTQTLIIGSQVAFDTSAKATTIAAITTAADTDAPVYYIANTAAHAQVLTLTEIETAIAAGSSAAGQGVVAIDNGTSTFIYTDAAMDVDAGSGAGLILQATLVGITGATGIATGDLISV